MRRRRGLGAGLAVLAAALVTAGATPSGAFQRQTRHRSGITVLTGDLPTAARPGDRAGAVLARADDLSQRRPEDFGYPYLDGTTVVLPASAAWQAEAAATGAAPVRLRHSRAQLQTILEALTGPQPDGTVVTADHPDPLHQRVVLEVAHASDAFLDGVARRFDPGAIAVHVGVVEPLTAPADDPRR